MSEVHVIIRTRDRSKKDEVDLSSEETGEFVIQTAVDSWNLPRDTDYTLIDTTSGEVILPMEVLGKALVKDGDVLELQPVRITVA